VPESRAGGHPDGPVAYPCRLFVLLARDVVVARQGKLLAGQPGLPLREIADLNDHQTPEPAPAPAWAHTRP
jgi:hypothetical protein